MTGDGGDKSQFDGQGMLAELRGWIEIESPTTVPEAVNRMVDHVERAYRDTGATLERIPGRNGFADHLIARSSWGAANRTILVLSHLDTVHPIGFIQRLPFKVEGDIAYGPGIYDMKGGAFLAFHAFREMARLGTGGTLPVTQLFVSDEEVGSPTSREIIEREAHNAKYVLVTEPAREGGKIVTARKGTARFQVRITGQAAHSGSRHQDGRSAIRELARQILAIEAFTDYRRDITTNVGIISGGTRANVVPEEALAEVDMRVASPAQADEMVARMLNLKPHEEGVSVTVTGGMNRPPYEKDGRIAELFNHARKLAEAIGYKLEDLKTGGGSDGNFTAAIAPTLDGLGVDGKGGHTSHEQIYISSIAPRSELLYRLFQTLK
jgi:glutamate carboxypeptidase